MPVTGTDGAPHVRAVERALELLFRVAAQPGGVSLHQLAQQTGCSKSTAHRLLGTLERLEVVERDHQLRHYRLGRRARELWRTGWPQSDLRQAARPYMQELRDHSQETVTLHLLEGAEHVLVEQYESPQEIRRTLPLGQRTPLLRGATAKALLAFLPPEEVEQILGQTRTADDAGPSEQELEDIRSLGYAFSVAERVAGGTAISVPILDRMGGVCAALSISGPSFRFTPARATCCAPQLIEAAEGIAGALGYSGPSGGNAYGHRSA